MKKLVVVLVLLTILAGVGLYAYSRSVRLIDVCFHQYDVYKSSIDQDGDGVDDQSDILQNAVDYVSTRPKYESKWYATGYPDDNKGVCTDVVANALKNAGYDLMQLVYQDRINHPERYEEEVIDMNIDFRRVRNLKIYFDNHAISLPTTFEDLSLWQGGDIVVYKNHIGIVSDRRNFDGVPYIIHHYGKTQIKYETDTLDSYEVQGHYRIS